MMVVKFQNSVLYFSARRFGTGQGPDARVEMVMGWAWPLRGLGLWAGMVPGNGVGRGGEGGKVDVVCVWGTPIDRLGLYGDDCCMNYMLIVFFFLEGIVWFLGMGFLC